MLKEVKKILLGKGKTDKELFFWNAAGSGIYAVASMFLTYFTIRIIGVKEGGIFAIALTLAQMFIYIAYFEMRNYEVTDAENKYSFSEYHGTKIVLCFIMLIVILLYCELKHYSEHKTMVVVLVSVYRMLDGYADVYEAGFHKQGRLDLAGKSMAFRTVISVFAYFITLEITHNLLIALTIAIILGITGVLIFDIWIFDIIGQVKVIWKGKVFCNIIWECFPLFLGMFLWTYLLSASRIAVDNVLSSEYQSIYQIVFMPISVINLFAGFLVRPSLLTLTRYYTESNMNAFWKIIKRMLIMLLGITIFCMFGAFIVGIPVLSLIVNINLTEYRNLLVFLVFSGGINAIASLFYIVLTIFRNRFEIMSGYSVAALSALVLSARMVQRWQLWGAAASYALCTSILLVIFIFFMIKETKGVTEERSGGEL